MSDKGYGYVIIVSALTPHQNYETRVIGAYSDLGLAGAVADNFATEPGEHVVVQKWRLNSLNPTEADCEWVHQAPERE